jgi:ribosome biogenesis GTPase A
LHENLFKPTSYIQVMSHFGWIVHHVIQKSNVVLEVLDARFIDETRNKEVEHKILSAHKILIHVINKCDFLEKDELERIKKQFDNCVFVSAKKHFGTRMLKEKIMILSKQNGIKQPFVGVIGYPNVGKSSVINALKGLEAAPISSQAGFTRGVRAVRISKDLVMFDTPGVIDKSQQEEDDLVLIGAKNPASMADPSLAVVKLIKKHPGVIEKHYGTEIRRVKEKTIEDVALKLNMKKRGNIPDNERAAIKVLIDWQSGKIKK